ncbi:hypothetical protein BD626DRAFT_566478 [Schizophyllum amplum]|uniref:BHLH domain-containing protein n=1 Tax=Schizophyllum amplum TaxID=97359 RepID=A0A550CM35_9AGAR|nr:hypothetical protein BD626DRAFT_566478 [Auriculariopsis ampla]
MDPRHSQEHLPQPEAHNGMNQGYSYYSHEQQQQQPQESPYAMYGQPMSNGMSTGMSPHMSPQMSYQVPQHQQAYQPIGIIPPSQYHQSPVYASPPHVSGQLPAGSPPPPSPDILRRSHDSDEDDNMGVNFPIENLASSRKEATRRQRIEAEQRRRDDLRDGYARLKDSLPSSNQKSSKVMLLERAVNRIRELELENQEMQRRLSSAEAEVHRLRALNEKITLGDSQGTPSPSPATTMHDTRPLSPPPDAPPIQTMAPPMLRPPPSEGSTSSMSDNGY